MKKNIYLHIGRPKTGTSALQYFLLQSRGTLAQKGISYPGHDLDINGISSGNAKEIVSRINADFTQAKALTEDMLKTENETLILSSEYFFHLKTSKIEKIRELFENMDVRIIVYIRRQDFLMMSAYHQGVKRRGITTGFSDWYERVSKNKRWTYSPLLQWSSVFGKQNLIVRPYETCQFYGGTIFSDFLHHAIGMELSDDFVIPHGTINPGLHQIVLEYKRMYNFLPIEHAQRVTISKSLYEISEKFNQQRRKDYPMLSPGQRLQVIHDHADENATVAREYLGREDGTLFYDPLPDPNEEWHPYNVLLENDAKLINTFLAKNYSSVFINVIRGITSAHYSQNEKVLRAEELLIPKNSVNDVFDALSDGIRELEKSNNIYKHQMDALNNKMKQVFASCTTKAGVVLNRIFNKTPLWLRRPALADAKRLYRWVKKYQGDLPPKN